MIFLNKGLTAEERAKIEKPYSGNCKIDGFDYKDAGVGVGEFIAGNRDLFVEVGKLLDGEQGDAR